MVTDLSVKFNLGDNTLLSVITSLRAAAVTSKIAHSDMQVAVDC